MARLAAGPLDAAEIELRIMETTDLHGDLLQGNPMGDYIARARGLRQGEVHPMYKAMNLLGYDAANIGNHEFNYGLEFLLKSLSGANFPYVLANVFEADGDDDASNDKHYFQPYVLLEREFVDTDGEAHSLVIGDDKGHLDGRVTVKGIVETAEMLVPQLREVGAGNRRHPVRPCTCRLSVGKLCRFSGGRSCEGHVEWCAFGHAGFLGQPPWCHRSDTFEQCRRWRLERRG